MKFELVAHPFTYKDKNGKEREGLNYSLVREDGYALKVKPYVSKYEDGNGIERTIDNTREFIACATIIRNKKD